MGKVRLNTKAADGLRGLAALHVALGHFVLFTDWTTLPGKSSCHAEAELREVAGDVDEAAASLPSTCPVVDLFGGGSMGLFYMISGFVMTLGYGQAKVRRPNSEDGCCHSCWDALCCCICWSMDDDTDTEEELSAGPEDNDAAFDCCGFLRKRCARFCPLYYCTNIVGCLVLPCIKGFPMEVFWAALSMFALPTALFATSWHAAQPFGNGVTWSISTMLFFYLMYPLLVPRLQKVPREKLWCLAFVMYVVQLIVLSLGGFLMGKTGNNEIWYWFARAWPPFRIPVFIMGACAAYAKIYEEKAVDLEIYDGDSSDDDEELAKSMICPFVCDVLPVHAADILSAIWFVLTVLCLLLAFFKPELHMLVRLGLEAILPILFYDLLLAIVPTNKSDPEAWSITMSCLSSKPLVFIGEISMGLYLIHMLLAFAFIAMLRMPFTFPYFLPFWSTLVLLPASIFLGWLVTRFFEEPLGKCLKGAEKEKAGNLELAPTGQ